MRLCPILCIVLAVFCAPPMCGEELETGESGWMSGEYPVTSYAVLQEVFNLVGIPHQIGDKGGFGDWASLPMSSSFLFDRDIGSTSLMVTFLHMDGVNLKGTKWSMLLDFRAAENNGYELLGIRGLSRSGVTNWTSATASFLVDGETQSAESIVEYIEQFRNELSGKTALDGLEALKVNEADV